VGASGLHVLAAWRDDCNLVRPHGGLGDLTPAEVARIALAAMK
jgi:transposase InsO family protein